MTSKLQTKAKSEPALQLLLEPEPRYRAFVRNLLILFSPGPPKAVAAHDGDFGKDVFVSSHVPWWWFLESLLGHLIVVVAILILYHPTLRERLQARAFNDSKITYYSPSRTFPAIGSGARAPAKAKQPGGMARQEIRVAAGRPPGEALRAPDLKLTGRGQLRFVPLIPAPPMMPLSATGSARLIAPAGPGAVVAPPPEIQQGRAPRSNGLLQVSGVAPMPEIGGGGRGSSGWHGPSVPSAVVVGPPANVPSSLGRAGDINIGPSPVVAPAPALPADEQRMASGMGNPAMGLAAAVVVPPAPSIQGGGLSQAGGKGGLFSGSAQPAVVPPPVSVSATGSGGSGRGGFPNGTSPVAVPPAPAVQLAGNGSGRGRAGTLSGSGTEVVPPAPTIQAAGKMGRNGRGDFLGGDGTGAVPPPPSVQGMGGLGGSGRGQGSLSGDGLGAVPPPPSMDGAGRGGGGMGTALARADFPVEPAGPSAPDARSPNPTGKPAGNGPSVSTGNDHLDERDAIEAPVRIIGMVLSLPNSSYFSNYEVFIAERQVKKSQTQLIKLVYVSLPYQRKLSEYSWDNKVYKLRMLRDASCDETLLDMTWPQADPSQPGAQYPIGPPTLGPNERNSSLPCYRTTADDYRRAFARSH